MLNLRDGISEVIYLSDDGAVYHEGCVRLGSEL